VDGVLGGDALFGEPLHQGGGQVLVDQDPKAHLVVLCRSGPRWNGCQSSPFEAKPPAARAAGARADRHDQARELEVVVGELGEGLPELLDGHAAEGEPTDSVHGDPGADKHRLAAEHLGPGDDPFLAPAQERGPPVEGAPGPLELEPEVHKRRLELEEGLADPPPAGDLRRVADDETYGGGIVLIRSGEIRDPPRSARSPRSRRDLDPPAPVFSGAV
jgi:hypothetical protein